jgi:hypothetical protein
LVEEQISIRRRMMMARRLTMPASPVIGRTVSNACRVIAVFLLIGWLFAIGHLVIEHGSLAVGAGHQDEAGHQGGHPHGGTEHDGDHHHHDLTALASAQFGKAFEQKNLAPVWVPLYRALLDRLAAIPPEANVQPGRFDSGDSPPDERASGWLLVVHTALQVRGPSLAA